MRKRKWLVVLCVVCLAAAANLLIARIIAQRIRRYANSNSQTQYIFAPHPSHLKRSVKSENRARPLPEKPDKKGDGGNRDGMPLPN